MILFELSILLGLFVLLNFFSNRRDGYYFIVVDEEVEFGLGFRIF